MYLPVATLNFSLCCICTYIQHTPFKVFQCILNLDCKMDETERKGEKEQEDKVHCLCVTKSFGLHPKGWVPCTQREECSGPVT